jgi:hypothetical protein
MTGVPCARTLAIGRCAVLVQPDDDLEDRLESLAVEVGIIRSELLGRGQKWSTRNTH